MAEESDASVSSTDSSATVYYEMDPDEQDKSYDPLLGSTSSANKMDISGEYLDQLADLGRSLDDHMSLPDDVLTFPALPGDVMDCPPPLEVIKDDHQQHIDVDPGADVHQVEPLPYPQEPTQPTAMETEQTGRPGYSGTPASHNPHGRNLAESFVLMSPLAKVRPPVGKRSRASYVTERSKGAPFPDDTSAAATFDVKGVPIHEVNVKVAAPGLVMRSPKPKHYGIMEPHRQFVYRNDGRTPLRWTACGEVLAYEAACNDQLFEKFAAPVTEEDYSRTSEDSFVIEGITSVCDPSVSSGKLVRRTVDFIQHQCCPIIGCPLGPDEKLPAIVQKSRFTYMGFVQHFKNVHVQCQLKTMCRICGYTSFIRTVFTRHLENKHNITTYKQNDPKFKKGANIAKAYGITAFVNTVPKTFVDSEGLTVEFRGFLENYVPSSPVYRHWNRLTFAPYRHRMNPSQWWCPVTQDFKSKYGKDNLDQNTRPEKKVRGMESESKPQRDPSPLPRDVKFSRLDKQAPVVVMPAGAEVSRDELVAARARKVPKSRPASPAKSSPAETATSQRDAGALDPVGAANIFSFQRHFDRIHAAARSSLAEMADLEVGKDTMELDDALGRVESNFLLMAEDVRVSAFNINNVVSQWDGAFKSLLANYKDVMQNALTQAAKHRAGYTNWESEKSDLNDQLDKASADKIMFKNKASRLEKELEAAKVELKSLATSKDELAKELHVEKTDAAEKDRLIAELRAQGPSPEAAQLKAELLQAKSTLTTLGTEFDGVKETLKLLSRQAKEHRDDAVNATKRVGELEIEVAKWKKECEDANGQHTFMCEKVVRLSAQLRAAGVPESPSFRHQGSFTPPQSN